MPAYGRIPRPRHLFPEVAALVISSRRSALHGTRRLRQAVGVIPLWTVSAAAGVASIALATLLFFLSDPVAPALAAVTPGSAYLFSGELPAPRPEPDPVILPEPLPQPLPEPVVDTPPPIVNLPRAALSAWIENTQLPAGWNVERFITSTTQAPVQLASYAHALSDDWRAAISRMRQQEDFQPYVPNARPAPGVVPLVASDVAPAAESTADLGMGLVVRKSPPARVDQGSVFTYEINIENRSRDTLEHVEVREKLSAMDRLEAVTPSANIVGDELVWQLGALRGLEIRKLRVTLHLDARTQVLTETRVVPTSLLAAAVAVREPAPAPAPIVRPEPPKFPRLEWSYTPVKSLSTGEILSVRFTVKNVGDAAAEDVRIYVQLSPEFQHRYGDHVKNEVTRLEPGQSHTAILRARVKNPGDGRVNAALTMQGEQQEVRALNVPIESPAPPAEEAGPLSTDSLKPVPEFEDSLAWRAVR